MIYEKTGAGTHHGAVLCPLDRLLLASILLTSVPPLVSQFQKLCTLSLAGYGISELPRHFFRSLPNLSRLDLPFDKLTHLPESIGSGNTKRISLDVSFNNSTSLPHFLVDPNSSLDSSQLLSPRQRFFGTCTPHTPATPTLASPVALTLGGSGSRPYGFGGGMEESNIPHAGVSVDSDISELVLCVAGSFPASLSLSTSDIDVVFESEILFGETFTPPEPVAGSPLHSHASMMQTGLSDLNSPHIRSCPMCHAGMYRHKCSCEGRLALAIEEKMLKEEKKKHPMHDDERHNLIKRLLSVPLTQSIQKHPNLSYQVLSSHYVVKYQHLVIYANPSNIHDGVHKTVNSCPPKNQKLANTRLS
ncbi:hypothetical protein BLNAU_10211 [Blattamonas nauphoetae]|uniref:Uncharacterized protein n=1 Tax=Blattamonas nauphoetae TaxID=2049346 RepID=A0ABQ9XTS9_9EUKA|nr:hypothetical protein BLNAU_10211 [Blattamonas nauphoetae]